MSEKKKEDKDFIKIDDEDFRKLKIAGYFLLGIGVLVMTLLGVFISYVYNIHG